MEEIGLTYESGLDETLEMLAKAGADVDRDRARVTFGDTAIIARQQHRPFGQGYKKRLVDA